MRVNLQDCNNKRLIVLSRIPGRKDPTGKAIRRSGKSGWYALYPYKYYRGEGRTQREAIGDLMLQMSGYLELEIRG